MTANTHHSLHVIVAVMGSAAVGLAFGLIPLPVAAIASLGVLPGVVLDWRRRLWLPVEGDVLNSPAPMWHMLPVAARHACAGLLFLLVVTALVPLQASLAGPEFARYRAVTLGEPLAQVLMALKASAEEVKVVQERPTLVQQLTFRRQRYVSGATVEVDPLDEMVLTFHEDRLARVVVTYDRGRTEGLTDADLVDAFTERYGEPLLRSTTPRVPQVASVQSVGSWGDGEVLVTVEREGYSPRLRLTLSLLAADATLRAALSEGAALTASEAPGLELARRTAAAAALQERAERIRRDNKASFKP